MAVSSNRTMEYENPLCFELQRKFQNRGLNSPKVSQKIQSSEMVRRITDGMNPYENVQVKKEQVRRSETVNVSRSRPMSSVSSRGEAVMPRPMTAPVTHPLTKPSTVERPVSSGATQTKVRSSDGRLQYVVNSRTINHSRAYEEKNNRGFVYPDQRINSLIQSDYDLAFRSGSKVRDCARRYEADYQKAQRLRRHKGLLSIPILGESFEILGDAFQSMTRHLVRSAENLAGTRSLRRDKTVAAKKKASKIAIAMGIVFAVLLMMIIYSFAQVSEIKSELSDLNATRDALVEKQSELNLDLEKRDDIRIIQEIALTQLGMVSADKVESRYVSVVSGDQINLD